MCASDLEDALNGLESCDVVNHDVMIGAAASGATPKFSTGSSGSPQFYWVMMTT